MRVVSEHFVATAGEAFVETTQRRLRLLYTPLRAYLGRDVTEGAMVLGADGDALTRIAASWFKENNVLREDIGCASDGRHYISGRLVRAGDAGVDGSEVDMGDAPASDLWVVSYMRDLGRNAGQTIKFRCPGPPD